MKIKKFYRWQIDPPNGHKCKLILISMEFGEIKDGICTDGDRMIMGEIGPEGPENTPLSDLPCRNSVCFFFKSLFKSW